MLNIFKRLPLGFYLVLSIVLLVGGSAMIPFAQTGNSNAAAQQSPTPTPTVSPKAKKSPKTSPSPTPTPTVSPTIQTSPTPTVSPSPTPTSSPKPATYYVQKPNCNCSPATKNKSGKKTTVKKADSGITFVNEEVEKKAELLVSGSNFNLKPGEFATVKLTVNNSSSAIKYYDPESKSINKVDLKDGVATITAGKPGNGHVTFYLEDDDKVSRQVNIRVSNAEIGDFNTDAESFQLTVGENSNDFTYEATTANGSKIPATLRAEISNPEIAEVKRNDDGTIYVTGKKIGEAVLTVYPVRNPKLAIKTDFSVVEKAIKEIKLEKSEISLESGKTTSLTATATNNDGSAANVEISNLNPNVAVAALEDGKLKVVGNQAGTTMITVKSGNLSKNLTVTVTKSAEETKAENDKKEAETKTGFVATVNPFNYSGTTWLILLGTVIALGIVIFVVRRMRA